MSPPGHERADRRERPRPVAVTGGAYGIPFGGLEGLMGSGLDAEQPSPGGG